MIHERRIALIPAYEPTAILPELAEKLSRAGFKPLVVDDGSGDDFHAVFHETEKYAVVLTHEHNRGKGCALKTGLGYIQENCHPDAVVVTLDADGQHRVEDALRVADRASQNTDTLILGCRSFDKDVPARSRFGNTVTRFVYRLSTGSYVSDTQTGLRAFGAELIPFLLSVAGERYEYEMNVLLEASRRNIPIGEVTIETIYYDNNAASHFDTIRDSYRVYREIVKFAASSFLGFLVDYGMYSLLVLLTGGLGTGVSIPLSNIAARIVSASVNYSVNKKLVFKSNGNVAKTAAQYILLAGCILAGNTVLLSFLVGTAGMNKFAAKIITEITFFTASWLVQKFFIFRKKEQNKAGGTRLPNGERGN